MSVQLLVHTTKVSMYKLRLLNASYYINDLFYSIKCTQLSLRHAIILTFNLKKLLSQATFRFGKLLKKVEFTLNVMLYFSPTTYNL